MPNMSERSPRPEGRKRGVAGRLGALVGRVQTYFAEQQKQIAIENSIPDDRLEEIRRRMRRVSIANEYEPGFGGEVEVQLHAIEEAFPETPHMTRWVAAYNRALITRLCEARCAIPYPNLTQEDAETLRYWGFAIPLHLGATTGLFALAEFPDQWDMRPAHVEPSLEGTTVAYIYDVANNPRLEVTYDMRAGDYFSGDPYGKTVIYPMPEQHGGADV